MLQRERAFLPHALLLATIAHLGMVPIKLTDERLLTQPRKVIQDTFEKYEQHPVQTLVNTLSAQYARVFSEPLMLEQIPYVEPSSISALISSLQSDRSREDGILVRWRCMIQDTGMGNELCLATLTTDGRRVCGLYGADAHYSHANQDDAAMNTANIGERTVFFGVSVPGETAWAHDHIVGASTSLSHAIEELNVELSDTKRTPRNEHPSVTALVKVYDVDAAEQFKTSDVIDVVGLLELSTSPQAHWHLDENDLAEAPILPCVHALYARCSPPIFPAHLGSCGVPEDVRASLIQYFTQVLGGDALVAEYILLALLGRVHARKNGIVIGPFSINVTGLDRQHHEALISALEQIMPAVVCQPLSLAELNDVTRPLYVCGTDTGIQAGRLQLPHGTCVVVDESGMDEGQLHDAGVRNIRALFSLLQQHTLPYVFPFSELDIPTDLVIIVLSQSKSLLPVDAHIHARPHQAPHIEVSPSILHTFRLFLANIRQKSLTIPVDVSDHIQDDFVQMRKSGARRFDQDDLQRCLHLSRLLSLSHGLEQLTTDMWSQAKVLDSTRAERVALP